MKNSVIISVLILVVAGLLLAVLAIRQDVEAVPPVGPHTHNATISTYVVNATGIVVNANIPFVTAQADCDAGDFATGGTFSVVFPGDAGFRGIGDWIEKPVVATNSTFPTGWFVKIEAVNFVNFIGEELLTVSVVCHNPIGVSQPNV